MMDLLHTPETWATLSLVLFFGILGYFGAHRMIIALLDAHIAHVRAELKEARSLREDAGTKLEKAQREFGMFTESIEHRLGQARKDAQRDHDHRLQVAQATIDRRLVAAQERIAQAEIAAQRDIRHRAISIATAAATEVVQQLMTEDQRAKTVDAGIRQVQDRFPLH